MWDKIKRLCTNPLFVPVICLTLLVLLILFAGPYIAFAGYTPLASLATRLLIAILLIASYVLYKYIKHLKSLQKQDKLVAEIAASDDDANQAIDAEANALKEKFKTAFAALKEAKGGPQSLTEIPWYMIIGSPGAGKTTLLSNSGLPFPLAGKLDNKVLQGVGGTKNCDWWITEEAVLLDTAGRYSSQDSFQKVDESGWRNFLSLIKRYRKKPISGLLVSVSMTDIIHLNEYELSQQLSQIKQRIAEVNDYFNTRFPIYLVITKSDMLAGFTQFFESFSHKEREQAFGVTFEPDTSVSGSVADSFEQAFSALCNSVTRRQWARMSMERDAGKKSLLYSFGEQLSSLKPSLHKLIANLSASKQGGSNGIIRGLYFTSGTQTGAPIDRMIARVSQVFGLQVNDRPMWNNDQRSYFIKDLLQQVVFAEADRFGTLAGYELRKKRIKQMSLGLFCAMSLVLCIGLFTSFKNNSYYLSLAEASVDKWVTQYESPANGLDKVDAIRSHLPALNEMAENINGLQDTQAAHFSGLGLSQTRSIQGALNASYSRLLKTALLPFVQQQLEQHLQRADKPSQQYQALKTYLMLAESGTLRDNEYIKDYLFNHLGSRLSQAESLQLLAHVESLVDNQITIDLLTEKLIADARNLLRAQPLGEIYYQQFKRTYTANKTEYLSMAQLAGSNWRNLLNTDKDDIKTIAKLYSPALFSQVIEAEIDAYIDSLSNETWVLGAENVLDKKATAAQIETQYAQDYADQWRQVLNSVSVKPLANLATLNSSLQLLTQANSPIFALLNSVAEATQLTSIEINTPLPFAQQVQGDINSVRQQLDRQSSRFFVTSRFSQLHELMAADRKVATEQSLSALVQEVSVALSFQMQSTQPVAEPISLNALQGFGFLQVAPLNRWVNELVNSINTAQSQLKKRQWNALWQNRVLPQCQSIVEHKYPFQQASESDANPLELVQLFSASGSLFRFFNNHLAQLVNTQTSPWQWRGNALQDFQFAPQVLPFFERAFTLQQSLFKPNSNEPQLQYVLTPVYLDPRLARLRMNIYGSSVNYQFGRPIPTNINWPPQNVATRSSINMVRRDASELVTTEEGIFALTRLIQAAQVSRISPNKVEVTFSKNDFKSIFELSTANPADPLGFLQLSSFTCLQGL